MATLPRISRKWTTLLHCMGLSSVGAALFLQTLVFSSIVSNGYFMGVEQSPLILYSEVGMTGFAIGYFTYMFFRFVHAHT